MIQIMHLDADAFFASVEQGFNPKLRGKPVIVGGLAHERGCVHTASYEARRCGIATGMSLMQAQERCPDAVFLKGDYRRYRAAGAVIRDILLRFSPDVEISSIDDAYVDLTHVRRRCPSPVNTAERIQQAVRRRLNISVSIGIASSKLIARIASGLHKPGGITAVPAGMERAFLSALPLRALRGIGSKTERLFHELGVSTIGGLAELPKTIVVQLLGNAAGETIWQYAQGNDARRVQTVKTPRQIGRETSFSSDTNDERLVSGTLRYLSERIAAQLRENGWRARRIHIKVYYADGKFLKKSSTLRRPTGDGRVLGAQAQRMYADFPRRRVRIRLAGVTALDIFPDSACATLFDALERSDRLNGSIDRVRKRFGFMSLAAGSTLTLHDYYRMEKHGYILHTPALSQ